MNKRPKLFVELKGLIIVLRDYCLVPKQARAANIWSMMMQQRHQIHQDSMPLLPTLQVEYDVTNNYVPESGVEPIRMLLHWYLKPARLPFRHPGCRSSGTKVWIKYYISK